MSHLSQNLERLIQMISIEQLLGLVKQNNNDNKTNADILTTPIVQKVVKAYEDELQTLNNVTNPNSCIKDYSNDIAKIHEQLASINSSLLQLTDAIKNIHISTNVAKRSSEAEEAVSSNEVVVASSSEAVVVASLEEEHVRLKIEEKQEVATNEAVVDSDNDISSSLEEEVASLEEEVASLEEDAESVKDEQKADEEEDESEKEISDEEEEVASSVADEEEVEEVEEVVEEEEESEKEISDEEEEVASSVADVEEVVKEDVEEEEEEVFEIEIDDVTYYATSEENGILYEVDKDGEVGKKVGIIKDGEPIFS